MTGSIERLATVQQKPPWYSRKTPTHQLKNGYDLHAPLKNTNHIADIPYFLDLMHDTGDLLWTIFALPVCKELNVFKRMKFLRFDR